jgi:hypothetical protein
MHFPVDPERFRARLASAPNLESPSKKESCHENVIIDPHPENPPSVVVTVRAPDGRFSSTSSLSDLEIRFTESLGAE